MWKGIEGKTKGWMDGILLRRTRDFFLYAIAENERFEEGSVKLRVQRLQDPASPGSEDCEFMQPRAHSPYEIGVY